MNIVKVLLVLLGTISLGIGIIGIVIPGLPTTPFLLLTAGLYVKSSDRLYQKLISSQYLGAYIRNYQSGKGMTLKAKLYSILLMWIMIFISCVFFIPTGTIKLVVLFFGCIGTIAMGLLIPTAKKEQ